MACSFSSRARPFPVLVQKEASTISTHANRDLAYTRISRVKELKVRLDSLVRNSTGPAMVLDKGDQVNLNLRHMRPQVYEALGI